jgi:hypothetical protein
MEAVLPFGGVAQDRAKSGGRDMTSAAALAPAKRVDLLDAFTERAAARAYLWFIGEFELAEAVDALQSDAEQDGLVKRVGQDEVQKTLSKAFAPYRTEPPTHDITFDVKSEKRPTPRTTIEAIIWSVRERGPQALHDPANIERLSRCDEAAISEIDRRISKLEAANAF